MRIGAIGSYGFSNYRITNVYGNPRNLQPIKKIGQENASGETVAVLTKEDRNNQQEEKARSVQQRSSVQDYQNIMDHMRAMTRFSADTIPMASAI